MLRTLSIRDFVIVDAIELEFARGFSVFTGETGAGKSILIDALQLALGGRGDASMVREGAAKADITADFALTEAATAWLEQNEFAVEEGGALLRRVIDNAGRSKAYINGIAATASQLRELGEMLVDRSEERRVGKECSSRWSPSHKEKKGMVAWCRPWLDRYHVSAVRCT